MKREQDDMGAPNPDNKDQADDVATLYSWANLHGAKYRDFSASRQEARAQMRQRVLADRARLAREEAQQQKALPVREESVKCEFCAFAWTCQPPSIVNRGSVLPTRPFRTIRGP